MNHNHSSAGKLLSYFTSRAPAADSVVTLGGTGPNGSCQIAVLELLGPDRVHQLKTINILSGSSFGYFIYLAFYQGMMRMDNYLSYDRGVRELHGASMLRALRHFCSSGAKNGGLYDNRLIKATVFHLFKPEYADRALRTFSSNIAFWSYCSNSRDLIKITPEAFPDMKVWQVITACLSIKAVHGEFSYGGHRFSDPMFCPLFKKLFKLLVQDDDNHLYLNYKRTEVSKNLVFLKNQPLKIPLLALVYDFLSFTFNFRNGRLNRTHRDNALLLANKGLSQDEVQACSERRAG